MGKGTLSSLAPLDSSDLLDRFETKESYSVLPTYPSEFLKPKLRQSEKGEGAKL